VRTKTSHSLFDNQPIPSGMVCDSPGDPVFWNETGITFGLMYSRDNHCIIKTGDSD
jgi:hypothetical protein